MKILLVDDEAIALQTMENIIRQSDFKSHTILTASNAADAWTIIQTEHPDILFSDIQMPCENGIHLLQKISESQLKLLVIFVSGYSEFSYAQAALRYDAFDYLLKPLNSESFLACLKKAINAIQEQENIEKQKEMLSRFFKENQSLLKKQFMETLLINPVTSFSPEQLRQCLSLGLNPDLFYLIGIKCNTTNRMNILQNQEYYISYSLSKKINKDYDGIASCYIGNIVYILMPVTSADPVAEVKSLAHSLICYTREKLFSSITIGISEPGNSIQQFPKLNKQIQYCFSYKASDIVSPEDSILFFAEINDYNSSIIEINEIISNLINAIQTHNLSDALEIGDAFFSLIQNENLLTQQDAIKLVELNLHIQLKNFLDDSRDSSYLTTPITRYCMEQPCCEHSRTVFSNCIKNIIQELSCVTTRNTGIIVNTVIEYINKNYEKQIGLNDAAEFINRNSSYISRLLKKELSMGFSQLLTERRMEAAKDLLAHTTMKVSDISEKVGYTSTKYFNQVFYTNFQMAPTDYRFIMKQL